MSTGKGHYTGKHYQGSPAVRGHFDDQHFQGNNGEEITPNVDPCSLPTYAARTDIELIFGKTNTRKWADVDNEYVDDTQPEPTFIAERICWALAQSKEHIDNRLRGGPYVVPFVATLETDYPQQIVSMSARLAGVILYDARGIVDAEGEPASNTITPHRDMVNKFLSNVLGRTIRLDLPESPAYPMAWGHDDGLNEAIESRYRDVWEQE